MNMISWIRLQSDRVFAIGCWLSALLALLLGWLGVAGTPHVAEQLPYFVSGGLLAVVLVTLGAATWVSADLRDDWRELRMLRQQLAAAPPSATSAGDVASPVTGELVNRGVENTEEVPLGSGLPEGGDVHEPVAVQA